MGRLLCCAALAIRAVLCGQAFAEPWDEMDYGNHLCLSLQVSPQNIARKGIAIRLDDGSGGVSKGRVFALYDTDTMRCAAIWTGRWFIDWQGLFFNGKHRVHPSIVGSTLISTEDAPGWGKPGTASFTDERIRGRDGQHYGPLPRSWLHWKGLYRHAGRAILTYSVGDCNVLEMPSYLDADGTAIVARCFEIGPRPHSLTLAIASAEAGTVKFSTEKKAWDASASEAAECFVMFRGDQHDSAAPVTEAGAASSIDAKNTRSVAADERWTICGFRDWPKGASWHVDDDGEIRLVLPAGNEAIRFAVAYSQTPSAPDVDRLQMAVAALPDAVELQALCAGGPRNWEQETTTTSQTIGSADGPYVVESIGLPDDNPYHSWMRLGGFDFFADSSRAAVCTVQGDMWIVDGLGGDLRKLGWRRIATGMFQPLGIKIVGDQIFVTCRDQITILRDLNGDGETDFYENFNNDAQVTEHFHEFATGLETDRAGNYYYAKAARHELDALVPQHGTLLRVAKDGSKTDIVATGFRAPNGVCVNDDGTFIVSDQEGHWVPQNCLHWVIPQHYYGYKLSYDGAAHDADECDQPFVWIQDEFDNSPSQPLWVISSKWGPLEGKLINTSYGNGGTFLILPERTGGEVQGSVNQGGVVRLPIATFPTGAIRGRFHPVDGQLYVCGLFGWSSSQTAPGGLYRVRYTGKPLHCPIELHAGRRGIEITFSRPLDIESAADWRNYSVSRWNYRRTSRYGSEKFKVSNPRRIGIDPVRVDSVVVSDDGKSVFLKIPDMQPAMQMEIAYDLTFADGQSRRDVILHTVHELHEDTEVGEPGGDAGSAGPLDQSTLQP